MRRRKRAANSPEQAVGFVTCLGCSAWPVVGRMKSTGIWVAYCLNCSGKTATGSTRKGVREAWNEQHERFK